MAKVFYALTIASFILAGTSFTILAIDKLNSEKIERVQFERLKSNMKVYIEFQIKKSMPKITPFTGEAILI